MAVGLVVPVVVSQVHGALGVPRGDDWSYLRTLFAWVDTGELSFNGWVSMTLVGQLLLAAPIVLFRGHDIAAVQLLTAALGVVGLLAVMRLGRLRGHRLAVATLVALLVALSPSWGALTISFMTDVPAFAISMVAIVIAAHALSQPKVPVRPVLVALAIAFFGFTVRQYAAVPLVAIAVVSAPLLWRSGGERRRRVMLVALVAIVAATALFLVYWRAIPDAKTLTPTFPDSHSLSTAVYKGAGLLRLLGLVLVPALLLAGPARILRRSWASGPDTTLFVAAGVGLPLVYTGWEAPRIAFAGNYVVPDGILSRAVIDGARPDIFPGPTFDLMIVIGTLAAVLLAVAAVPALTNLAGRLGRREWEPSDPAGALLALTLAGYAAVYLVAAVTGLPLYDRYLLPVIPLAAYLLLTPGAAPEHSTMRASTTRRRGAVAVTTLLLGGIALVYTLDSASFDGTRWDVAQAATREGWGVSQIRGSFEWINFHADDADITTRRQASYCVRVRVNPSERRLADGDAVVVLDHYWSPLVGDVPIAALRTQKPCTPANPALLRP